MPVAVISVAIVVIQSVSKVVRLVCSAREPLRVLRGGFFLFAVNVIDLKILCQLSHLP